MQLAVHTAQCCATARHCRKATLRPTTYSSANHAGTPHAHAPGKAHEHDVLLLFICATSVAVRLHHTDR